MTYPDTNPQIEPNGMDNERTKLADELKKLETRVDDLLLTCGSLREENKSLRRKQAALTGECAALLEKNERARSRVEAMIARLKSMEAEA